jgi:GT2 family glycosyltransferase
MFRFIDGNIKEVIRIDLMTCESISTKPKDSEPSNLDSNHDLDICIVVFDTPWNIFETTLESLLHQDIHYHLKVVDHSLTGDYRAMVEARNISYLHVAENPGYGTGNNKGLFETDMNAPYCLVLNPDVIIHRHALSKMIAHFKERSTCQIVVPMVVDPSGEIQYLSRRLPRPIDLFVRRFGNSLLKYFFHRRSSQNEYRDCQQETPLSVDSASGSCFMIRRNCFENIKGFDERYFLYMEDLDLSRRVLDHGGIEYLPCAKITHHHTRASYHSWPYLLQHIKSALQYFTKWGWWPLI